MTAITVGCDPEFFVQKIKEVQNKAPAPRKGYYLGLSEEITQRAWTKTKEDSPDDVVPICGLLGGTKTSPLKMANMDNGFAMQEDGAAVEFNIPPAKTPGEFSTNVANALEVLCRLLKKKDLTPSKVNNLTLKQEWLAANQNLAQIGCDPDFLAHEEGPPKGRVAQPDKVGLIRGAGGHLHIGYPVELCPPNIMAQLLDLMIGLPFTGKDKQGERRKWWGHAGLYRPKPYGIEYRTLSNFWIWSPSQSRAVSAGAFALVESLQQNPIAWQAFYNAVSWEAVRNIIYQENGKAATALINRMCSSVSVYKDALQRAAVKSLKSGTD